MLLMPALAGCGLTEKGTHNAGKNCMWPGCHGYEAPAWTYAGSVFASEERSSPARDVKIIITDASGERKLKANSVGNFYTLDGNPSEGYHARMSKGDVTRTMQAEQTSGACNGCHTPDGQAPPLHIE
jgi:hypothetical protein